MEMCNLVHDNINFVEDNAHLQPIEDHYGKLIVQ